MKNFKEILEDSKEVVINEATPEQMLKLLDEQDDMAFNTLLVECPHSSSLMKTMDTHQ